MKPRIGEPVLIGVAKEVERDNPFAAIFGGAEKSVIGGDRSYAHDVWVCISAEEDRCVIVKLLRRGKKMGSFEFGADEPQMIGYDWYPINKCSEETLKTMTGYSLADDLLAVVNAQLELAKNCSEKNHDN
jgi:hypothetical protein